MPKLNFAQVFIHFFSNKNRYATKVFISEPHHQQESAMGRIFGIIEINTPSRENTKIIDQLIDAAERNYYIAGEEGLAPEQAFEKTLKLLNTLAWELISKDPAYASTKKDASAIREKLNLAIGIIKDRDLFLTSINSIGAFLLHKSKQEYRLIEIENESKGDNPVSIFDTIISGMLQDGDYLFFSNHDLLNFISKERIVKTVTSLPVAKAADYFKNSLLQHEGFNFASIIIQAEPLATEAKPVPRSLSSIGRMNAGEMATEKLLSPSLLPNFTASIKASAKKFGLSLMPKKSEKPKNVSAPLPQSIVAVPTHKPEAPSMMAVQAKHSAKKLLSNIGDRIDMQKFGQRVKNLGRKFLSLLNRIPNLSKILIAIVVLFGGFFVYAAFLPHDQFSFEPKNVQNQDLQNIEQLLSQAEAKLIYKDRIAAKSMVSQAQTQLQSVKVKNNQEQDFANSLSKKIDGLVAKIRNITLIEDPTLLYSISAANPAKIEAMVQKDNDLYIFDQANRQVSKIDLTTRAATPITGSFDGELTAASLDEKQNIYFITDKNELYRIEGEKIASVPLNITPDAKVQDIAFYNDRLYTLIPSKNQIFRHAPENGGFGGGVTWIQQSGVDVSKATAFKIDSSIWVSASDGQVINLFKGGQRPFKFGEIDPALTSIDDLIKSPDSNLIHLLDLSQKRILVVDTDGNLKTQYFSPNLTSLNSIAVGKGNTTIYAANGNDVYALLVSEIK